MESSGGVRSPELDEAEAFAGHRCDFHVRRSNALRQRCGRLVELRAGLPRAALPLDVRHVAQGVELKLAVLDGREETERLAKQLAGTIVVAAAMRDHAEVCRRRTPEVRHSRRAGK